MNAHAIRMTTTGGPEVLEYVEIDVPDPGPHQAIVAVPTAATTPAPSEPGVNGSGTSYRPDR